jgi:signal peptidase I
LLQGEVPAKSVFQISTDILAGVATGIAGLVAYLSAPVHRETSLKPVLVLQLISAIWFSILLLTLHYFRENVIEPFYINGRSMAPTINAGDRILVAKCDVKRLKRGDVAVFVPPDSDPDVRYVKRLVAFGGETVEIRADGRVYIDGDVLNGSSFDNRQYVPSVDGRLPSYSYLVPPGSYFFLGDNSTLSRDCRFYGAVPARDVIGVAYKIWWPLDRARALTQ